MTKTTFGEAVSRETKKLKKPVASKAGQNTGANTKPKKLGNPENLRPPWKPGQSGNPGGRPKKLPITDAIREALARDMGDGRTMADVVVDVLIEAAKKGDMAAIRELADRAEGKPVQVNHISGPGGGPMEIDNLTAEHKRKRIAELMAKANGTIGADGD